MLVYRPHDFVEDVRQDTSMWQLCKSCNVHFLGARTRTACRLCKDGWVKAEGGTLKNPAKERIIEGQLYKKVST